MKAQQIDKIVCQWAMFYHITLSDISLNTLVDTLGEAINTPPEDARGLSAFTWKRRAEIAEDKLNEILVLVRK